MPTRASLVGFDADADLSSVRLVALLPGGSRDSITTKLMPVRMVKVRELRARRAGSKGPGGGR